MNEWLNALGLVFIIGIMFCMLIISVLMIWYLTGRIVDKLKIRPIIIIIGIIAILTIIMHSIMY